MTASDFKALATGNPYLKLKMELENELTVLDNQKRAFNRSKDEYRHTISYCERNLPVLEKRLSQYDLDIAQSLATKSQDFIMRFDNQMMDNRAEAGDYLRKLITYNRSETKEVRTLAIFRGFELKMATRSPSEPLPDMVSLTISGSNQYSVSLDLKSDVGTIQRITNAIDHILEDQEKTEEMANNLKDKLSVARVEVEKVFPKEEDYQLVKAKYDILAPLVMTQTVEDIRYQLEEWLAQGFTSSEVQATYQALKEQYEDETLDYSFSKREIIGQLEVIITTRENDFPDLDEVTKGEYLDLVGQLDDLDKGKADYYRKQLT